MSFKILLAPTIRCIKHMPCTEVYFLEQIQGCQNAEYKLVDKKNKGIVISPIGKIFKRCQ